MLAQTGAAAFLPWKEHITVQVQNLRQEKDVLESKLKEFERSLQKLKDCTYQEATQKREYERRVQAVQADLRGAHLREQVSHQPHYPHQTH